MSFFQIHSTLENQPPTPSVSGFKFSNNRDTERETEHDTTFEIF